MYEIKIMFMELPVLFFAIVGASAAPAEAPDAKAAEVMRSILSDNAAFVAGKSNEFFAPFKDAQHPRATVVMCSDSRVHTHAFESQPDGDLFVVRNIGNQLTSNRGSVEYGVRHLHTPMLLIIGHVACGAIKAALSDYRALSNDIRESVDRLHLAVDEARKVQTPDQWRRGIEENVHYQVNEALTEFAEEVKTGKLVVVGAVYDFQDVYAQGRGRLLLLYVNGEKDPTKIPQTPLLHAAMQPQTVAPAASATVRPAANPAVTNVVAVEARPGGSIRVEFNEPVSKASIVPTSFASSKPVPGSITLQNLQGEHELATLEVDGAAVIVTPFEVLSGSTLVVTVTTRVADLGGSSLKAAVKKTVVTRP